MKRLSMLYVVLFILFGNTGCKSEYQRITERTQSFFARSLSGETVQCTDSTFLPLEDIDKYRDAVWQSWIVANQNLEEPKLDALAPLDSSRKYKWELPEELEPDATMPFYWGTKGEMKEGEGYPLFLYIHGSGRKAKEWTNGLRICSGLDDAPSLYFIPQIPNEGQYYRWWQKAKQFAWERLLRQAFISKEINPNRIYFFGISEGGYGSQRLASYYADYLAGAGPMAAGGLIRNAPAENCRNIAFSLRTGDQDKGFCRNILTEYISSEFDRLQGLYPQGFVHNIELIPGFGHHIDYKPTTPWLKQFVRNPYPKSVMWENFEMDGIYRKGFYNLAVLQRSNDDTSSRTFYEMNIKDNHIELKVDLVTYDVLEKDPKWGLPLKFAKSFVPATKGKVLVYLNNNLVDLSKELTLTVNGREAFKGMVKPELRHLVNSCATFYDSLRLFPAAIEVNIAE